MKEKRCGNCEYFERDGEYNSGNCLRYPPTVCLIEYKGASSIYPKVDDGKPCGEYKEKRTGNTCASCEAFPCIKLDEQSDLREGIKELLSDEENMKAFKKGLEEMLMGMDQCLKDSNKKISLFGKELEFN